MYVPECSCSRAWIRKLVPETEWSSPETAAHLAAGLGVPDDGGRILIESAVDEQQVGHKE